MQIIFDGTIGVTLNNVILTGSTSGTATFSVAPTLGTDVLTFPTGTGTLISMEGGGVVPSTSGNVLTSNGTTWISAVPATTVTLTIANDTSTASNLYPVFASVPSGVTSYLYTASPKLLYKPSTGALQTPAIVLPGSTSGSVTVNAAAAAGSTVVTLPSISTAICTAVTKQKQLYTAFTTGGSGSAFTLTPTPAIGSYATGTRFFVIFHTAADSVSQPTINISGLGAQKLMYYSIYGIKSSVTPYVTPSGWMSDCIYDGTDFVMLDIPTITPQGNQTAIFGFGAQNVYVGATCYAGAYNYIAYYNETDTVSNTGVTSGATGTSGQGRAGLAGASYGIDKVIFAYGTTNQSGGSSISNLVTNTGVTASNVTGVGTARWWLAACRYGFDKAIFGFGQTGGADSTGVGLTNLISNTGVVANDVAGVGTARTGLACTSYGYDKAIFAYGKGVSSSAVGVINIVSNTGVVGNDVAVLGTARQYLAGAGYGMDKGIFAYGGTSGVYVSMSNLVSNTGVLATDTTGVGTGRQALGGSSYGSDKAVFGYGTVTYAYAITPYNLVSNTGVVAKDIAAAGASRWGRAAASFG